MEKKRNATYEAIDNRITIAFLEIAAHKKSVDISVMEVCRKAYINRATFYRHFHGVWEIVDRVLGGFREKTKALISNYDYNAFMADPKSSLGRIRDFFIENQDFLRKAACVEEITLAFDTVLKDAIQTIMANPSIPGVFRGTAFSQTGITFYLGGLLYVCMEWLRGHLGCSLDEAMETILIYSKLLTPANEIVQSNLGKR